MWRSCLNSVSWSCLSIVANAPLPLQKHKEMRFCESMCSYHIRQAHAVVCTCFRSYVLLIIMIVPSQQFTRNGQEFAFRTYTQSHWNCEIVLEYNSLIQTKCSRDSMSSLVSSRKVGVGFHTRSNKCVCLTNLIRRYWFTETRFLTMLSVTEVTHLQRSSDSSRKQCYDSCVAFTNILRKECIRRGTEVVWLYWNTAVSFSKNDLVTPRHLS